MSAANRDDSHGVDDDRPETEAERLDRNWTEILQELRVTQTGTQILTGFLLTLAFQPRFADLEPFQVDVYLVLVVLAALTTALGLAPVSLHRALFRQGAKNRIVAIADTILKITLVGVSLVLTGTILLIFGVVVGDIPALVASSGVFVTIAVIWFLVPAIAHRRRARRKGRKGRGES